MRCAGCCGSPQNKSGAAPIPGCVAGFSDSLEPVARAATYLRTFILIVGSGVQVVSQEQHAIESVLTPLVLLVGSGVYPSACPQDLRAHLFAGGNLTPEKARSLEAELTEKPEDLFARAQLIGYYMRQFTDHSADVRRHEHVLWLIEHTPAANLLDAPEVRIDKNLYPETFREATSLWSKQLEDDPSNLAILKNAAEFHTFGDRKTAIQLLERAQALLTIQTRCGRGS